MNLPSNQAIWLTFLLDGMNFCISSDYVRAIAIPQGIEPLPEAPKTIAGITGYGQNNDQLCVIEMREVFGRINLNDYINSFAVMKQMHVDWVVALDEYVHSDVPFSKTVDPHKCKFGVWYDTFTTHNARLNRLLRRIDDPHKRIHKCGAEIMELKAQEGDHHDEINELLAEAHQICDEDIVPLLDRLIDVYRAAHRGALLVLNSNSGRTALLVDEVCSLIKANSCKYTDLDLHMRRSEYIGGGIVDGTKLYFETDVEKLLTIVGDAGLENIIK